MTDISYLNERFGKESVERRLGLEEKARLKHRKGFGNSDNWYSRDSIVIAAIKASGLKKRGQRNAANIQIRRNDFVLPHMPQSFDGYEILHITDLHADNDPAAMAAVAKAVSACEYDLCVLTGDYRSKTFGSFEPALQQIKQISNAVESDMIAVLGNHDSIHMVQGLSQLGIEVLLNESAVITKGQDTIAIAGVDDPHYFQGHDIAKAASQIAPHMTSILLSHSPEPYAEASDAGFDVMLSGHTHGGQICLPGGLPVTLNIRAPRKYGRGRWEYEGLLGYTSIGAGTSLINVRYNCLPEVVIHTLRAQ